MSWDDDDFESQLHQYSEIETVPEEQFSATLPKTIQLYQQRIQSNNSTSIFDADYTLDSNISDSESTTGVKKNFEENLGGVFKNDQVTRIISGRGRGGRNLIIQPGASSRSRTEDDEIRQQIRKVAPIGYSNEITESAVRAHKMTKQREQGAASVSPSMPNTVSPIASKTSSPIISKTSSPGTSKSSLEFDSCSLSSSTAKLDLKKSPVLSEKSTHCSTGSGIGDSDYLTSQDRNGLSSSSRSDQNEEEIDEIECEDAKASRSTAFIGQPSATELNTGAIPKKPIPLSVMLKRSREAHRKKQLGHSDVLSTGYSTQAVEERLSELKIQEILQQDRLEEENLKKRQSEKLRRLNTNSGNEALSWRRKTNSPPRYSWGQTSRKKENKQLDIASFEDFPALR